MQRVRHVILTVLFSVFSVSIAIADENAMQLLEKTGTAAKTLNYDGIFAYRAGNKLQSIRIIHRADNDNEIERVLSLNGAAREVIRTNDLVTCIFPEGKRVHVNRRPLGRGFPSDLLSRLRSATDYYNVTLGTESRVANRVAQGLSIQPIDNYRYGYRLWVDKDSDLLLKSELVNEQQEVLETFAFSSVDINIEIDDALLRPQVTGTEMTWNRNDSTSGTVNSAIRGLSVWKLDWLPEGFVLVAQQSRLKANTGNAVEQRVYSDGLSSVSVFIEQIHAAHNHLKGGSRMGAVNAFGTIMNSHFVTVVGEVPQHTVEKIGNSIRYGTAGQ
jgi:sigma-E factor negative regulatory protein RseB